MNIKVIGTGCDKCDKLYENVMRAVEEMGVATTVEKVEDLMEIVKLGVMTSPTLMIDGKVVSVGRVMKKDEVKKYIQSAEK
ncbi:thioredoxin family protein [Faecalimonas sp.]